MTVDSTGKLLSGTGTVYYDDGSYSSGVTLEVNATAAYNSGWAAAESMVSVTSTRILGPSTTVGQQTTLYTISGGNITLSDQATYNKGWQDAANTLNVTTSAVYGPSTTVGSTRKVVDISGSTITVSDQAAYNRGYNVGYTEGQSSASSAVTLTGSWSGNTFTVEASNGKKREETFTAGTGTGNQTAGSQYTINTYNSSYKAYGYVNASTLSSSRLFTFNVDATSVFNAGWNACIDYMTENNGVSCLVYYSTWQPGAMRALYEFSDGMYTKATGSNQYWRYSGSVVTRYSLPDRK